MFLVSVQPYDDRLPAMSSFATHTSYVAYQFLAIAPWSRSDIIKHPSAVNLPREDSSFHFIGELPLTKLLAAMMMSGAKEPGHSLVLETIRDGSHQSPL